MIEPKYLVRSPPNNSNGERNASARRRSTLHFEVHQHILERTLLIGIDIRSGISSEKCADDGI